METGGCEPGQGYLSWQLQRNCAVSGQDYHVWIRLLILAGARSGLFSQKRDGTPR